MGVVVLRRRPSCLPLAAVDHLYRRVQPERRLTGGRPGSKVARCIGDLLYTSLNHGSGMVVMLPDRSYSNTTS